MVAIVVGAQKKRGRVEVGGDIPLPSATTV